MSPALARQPIQAGFTLLELIVVISIFAVFSLMAYGGLDSVLQSRARVEEAMNETAAIQKAYVRLREDFQQVRNRPARDGYGDRQPALRTDQQGRVEFTRGGWRNPLLLPRAGLERVSYRLDGKKLTRESWRVLDQAQDSKPVAVVLLDDVQEVRWRFLDSSRDWFQRWPPEDPNRSATTAPPLPLAVELELESQRWGKLRFLFRLGVEMARIPEAFGSGGAPRKPSPGETGDTAPPPSSPPPPPPEPTGGQQADDTGGTP